MRRWMIVGMLVALLAGALARGEEAFGPGLSRVEGALAYEQAEALAERLGVELSDGAPLYAPENPQPMNAYLVTDPQCQVGVDGDDMYLVSERGLTGDLTGYLERWMGDIEAASGGLIRFVGDANAADVLVVARQSFKFYGNYSGEGRSAEGYACVVSLTARQLTAPENNCALTATRTPEDTVALHGGERFWKTPPELVGTDQLDGFVDGILAWYGLGAKRGERGAGVKALQQALVDRGFLADTADGDFGPKTEAALQRVQEAYGLLPTGEADEETLRVLYFGE